MGGVYWSQHIHVRRRSCQDFSRSRGAGGYHFPSPSQSINTGPPGIEPAQSRYLLPNLLTLHRHCAPPFYGHAPSSRHALAQVLQAPPAEKQHRSCSHCASCPPKLQILLDNTAARSRASGRSPLTEDWLANSAPPPPPLSVHSPHHQ